MRKVILTTIALVLYLVVPVRAQNPTVKDMVVSNSSTDLLLYLTVEEAFREDMVEGVLNGIPAKFTFFVSLRELTDGRPDKQIAEITFDHILSYDPLKEQYKLEFSENSSEQVIESLLRAKALMAEANGVKVTSLENLHPGREYFLSVKVRLERKTLPLYFHYLIPFWTLRDYETDWHYVEFKY